MLAVVGGGEEEKLIQVKIIKRSGKKEKRIVAKVYNIDISSSPLVHVSHDGGDRFPFRCAPTI